MGSHLALLEMQTVIAEVVRRLRLEAPSPEPESQRVQHVTLVPADGGRVIARPRTREPVGPRQAAELPV